MLKDFNFDVAAWLTPVHNHFCELFPFPLANAEGYTLYFQHITVLNSIVAFGVKISNSIGSAGIVRMLHIVAFTSVGEMLKFFPEANQQFNNMPGSEGKPMQCPQMIVEMPSYVKLQYIIEALKNPNHIVSFEVIPNSMQNTPPPTPKFRGYQTAHDTNYTYTQPVVIAPVDVTPVPPDEPEQSSILVKAGIGLLLLLSL